MNNGIVAENVMIPEEKTGLIKDNYDIFFLSEDDMHLNGVKWFCRIVAGPKVGNWKKPFFGYLASDSTGGDIIGCLPNPSPLGRGPTIMHFLVNGRKTDFKVFSTDCISTPDFGCIIHVHNMHPYLIFGDLSDSNKLYMLHTSAISVMK